VSSAAVADPAGAPGIKLGLVTVEESFANQVFPLLGKGWKIDLALADPTNK
jgi:hypothetical protein